MGDGNGRSDTLYALVVDVVDLKVLIARQDQRMAELHEFRARVEERFDRLERDMTFMRKTLSDVVVVVQNIADRLVTMSETLADHGRRLDDHERRFDRIEQTLGTVTASLADHGHRLKRIEVTMVDYGQRFERIEVTMTDHGHRLDRIEVALASRKN